MAEWSGRRKQKVKKMNCTGRKIRTKKALHGSDKKRVNDEMTDQ